MPRNIVKGQFFAADLTITANTTYSTTTPTLRCENLSEVHLSGIAKGANAGSSGVVTFALQSCVGNEKWSTSTWQSITVTVAGTATVISPSEILNVEGLSAIRVASITNGDASYAISDVNLYYGAGIK